MSKLLRRPPTLRSLKLSLLCSAGTRVDDSPPAVSLLVTHISSPDFHGARVGATERSPTMRRMKEKLRVFCEEGLTGFSRRCFGDAELSRTDYRRVEQYGVTEQSGVEQWSVVEWCKVECGRVVQSGAGGAVHGTT